jgi:hypothetical protein
LIVVLGVAATLFFTLSGDDEDGEASPDVGSTGASEPTSAAAVTGVTYEITGTAPAPLDVQYVGEGGEDVNLMVTELPWSVTVDPAPDHLSIFAVNTSIDEKEDITLTVKRGDDVLRSCPGGAPCITALPE